MTRQRLLSVSGLLAVVLLLQWAVGLAGCVASLSARTSLPLVICHADGNTSVPDPAGRGLDGGVCPVAVQLAATLLPDPPAALPGPLATYAAAVLPHVREGWVPGRITPAHPARGPPAIS